MKILDVNYDKNTVTINFSLANKDRSIFIKQEKNNDANFCFDTTNIDFFIPFSTVLALTTNENIDLNKLKIDKDIITSFSDIQDIYLRMFPSLFKDRICLENYTLDNTPEHEKKDRGIGIFFSLGIDSFDSLLNMPNPDKDKKDITLINVLGLDINRNDKYLYNSIRENILNTAKHFRTQALFLSTNMREVMEDYILWTYGHGAVLCSIALLNRKNFVNIYIPSTLNADQQVPHGSHIDLDETWSSDAVKLVHHGIERNRLEKVVNSVSKDKFALDNLNVCYKNIGNNLNCGICNKCIITKLELYVANKLNDSNFVNKNLSEEDVRSLLVLDKVMYAFVKEITPHLDNINYKNILSEKLNEFSNKDHASLKAGQFKKNKNILFVDFNGVLSYKNFWFSLENKKHSLNKYLPKIETFLFKENIELVKKWMLGLYSSEEIHKLICDNLSINYDDLFSVFQGDCDNLDISSKILEKIKQLKPYYTCILATDNMDSFDRFTIPNNPILNDVFDRVDNSFSMKRMKSNDGGYYFTNLVKESKTEMGNCILIDDSNGNCRCFEDIGGQAYRTKNENEVLNALDIIYKNVSTKWEWQY